jgi:ATP-dependent DNA ligase
MPALTLPVAPPFPPMEARSVTEVPEDPQWEYEPKWDGFRCLLFRDGNKVELQSKACRPLTRYFPELVAAATGLADDRFVLDGEIAVPKGKIFSFDDLLQRIHPAASRIARLALETPAVMVVFDLLVDSGGRSLLAEPLSVRRTALEAFARRNFPVGGAFRLSPATTRLAEARSWLSQLGATLDGIIAKRRDLPYRSGDRGGMEKIKTIRSADCVVGGFRYHEARKIVGSLLLGLYDDRGLLDHVGFTSTIGAAEKPSLTHRLEKLIEPPGFTGSAPGGPSRWASERSTAWQPLKPQLVVEVCYDHFSGGRFRHGTRLLRWRPDKSPLQCTMDQVTQHQGNLAVLARLP